MASNANIYLTGYDLHVVGDFLPHLNCGICTLILRNAMHGCINHVFCKACITKHIECGIKINGNVTCPGGCNIIINPEKLEASKFADRMVNTLTTRCSNEGCIWQGDLLDLVQVHQINCNFLLQICINNGCNEKYLKKDILQHNEECLFKLLQCSYCQADILRMNKELHDVKCLNEQVKCIYYDIGCKKELRRKDIDPHEQTNHAEHTRLIYQNLINSNVEIKLQNNTMKQEFFGIKQENNTMKQEIVVLKKGNVTMKKDNDKLKNETFVMKEELVVVKEENAASKKKFEGEINILKEDVAQLKQQVQYEAARFHVHQNDDMKNHDSTTSDKIDYATNQVELMKSNEGVKNIDSLKKKLTMSWFCNQVLLSNDEKVLIIKCNNSNNIDMYNKDVTKCYETNNFDWLFRNFSLMDNKNIIMELINNTKYHFYEYQWYNYLLFVRWYSYHCYIFVFSLDLHHIKDTEVVVPDKLKMKIIDNEIIVEILNQKTVKGICLCTENYTIQLDHQKKLNLKKLNGFLRDSTPVAKGYAFLRLLIL